MTYYHGAHGGNDYSTGSAHVGQCWTSSRRAAEQYAGSGRNASLWRVEIEASALVVVEVDGYNPHTDTAPGDSAASLAQLRADGVDVVIYMDADETGREHDTVRLISDRAVALVSASMTQMEID